MELIKPTLKQRLSYIGCAIALVFSLSLYRGNAGVNPLSEAENHWQAIAAANPALLASRYRDDAVLTRSYGSLVEEYQGQSIYLAWRDFFSQYQIKDFEVVKQQQRDRRVEAQIQITAKSSQGAIVVLSMSYQLQFDPTGKIIKEVWQATPLTA